MQEIVLKFTHKKRNHEAPNCPCGEINNPHNPQFNPYEGTDGKFGFCHRCAKYFYPTKEQEEIKYVPVPKAPQKFIEKEPFFNWVFPDVIINPVPHKKPIVGEFYLTFYFRNVNNRLTAAKKMLYSFPKFKRVKEKHPFYLTTRDSGFYPCLFYEYDLTNFPNAKIILVESEKTAALLRYKFKKYLNEIIFIATSGSNGLTPDKSIPLKNRQVFICYDADEAGRECSIYTKSKLPMGTILDLFPDKNDGTDLGDVIRDIDWSFLQAAVTK